MIKEKDANAMPININIQKRRLAFFSLVFPFPSMARFVFSFSPLLE